MAFSSKDLIAPGVGAGLGILGSVLQGRAQNKGSERQWELLAQEIQRRNQMQGLLGPSTAHALGYRNPADVQGFTSTFQGQPSVPTVASGPSLAPTGASKVLGAAGTGLGIAGAVGSTLTKSAIPGGFLPAFGASKGIGGALGLGGGSGLLGLGAATIPVIGGLLAGGVYAANKIGQGRRTANQMTQGPQEQFGQAIASARSLPELESAYRTFMQSIQAWQGAGGNQRKVADQALNSTPALWETYQRRRAELGGR